jgi:HK97 family phage major capsid protein
MLEQAYSTIEFKTVDEEKRIIEGVASTPELDRQDDIMDSEGAKFTLPMPLLWQHRPDQPIGHVIAATVTKSGIKIRAQIERTGLLPEIDRAWTMIKSGLVRGLSIDWQLLESVPVQGKRYARHVKSWNWLALSTVTIPANASANILSVKQLDTVQRALSGTAAPVTPSSASAAATGVTRRNETHMVPVGERLQTAQADLKTKNERLTALMDLDGADGGLEPEQKTERASLTTEIETLADRIAGLKAMEAAQGAMARTVVTRAPQGDVRDVHRPHIQMGDAPEQKLPPGIELAKALICRAAGLRMGVSAVELARDRYPHFPRVQAFLKEVVPAGSTQDSTWAGPLVYPTNLVDEFIEFLRPQTIIGRIEGFTRVSFNSRIAGETSGGSGYWVGEGKAKPLTKGDYNAVTIPFTKVANIAVMTEELIRFSSPSAEARVRNLLVRALQERLDIDFIDPAKAAVSGVSPASITNGIANLNSAGVTLDSVDVDVQAMMSAFIQNHVMPTHWVMSNAQALALSLMRTSLGNYAFPTINMNGGTFYGLPVITSQYAVLGTPANNLIVLLSAPEIFMADDGGFAVDMSREASLEMDDAPTMDAGSLGSPAGAVGSQVVSMFQTNSVALRCERFIYWARRRDAGVVWMDDVNWAAGTN